MKRAASTPEQALALSPMLQESGIGVLGFLEWAQREGKVLTHDGGEGAPLKEQEMRELVLDWMLDVAQGEA